MELDVVLSHELIEAGRVGFQPPLLVPLAQELGCHADITNRSIKPYIEDTVLETWFGHLDAPFEISSDAARVQALSQPIFGDVLSVAAPLRYAGSCPLLELGFDVS